MTKRILSIFLLAIGLSTTASAVTKNKPFQLFDFHKGVDTYHNPTSLPPGFVQNANNILFDDVAPATKRSGYTVAWSTKAYQYTGLWTYTDATNTTWQLARSSDQITANNLNGSVVKIATVSINNLVGETNAFGNAYFVDQTQGVYYWNGTSTIYVGGSPLGSIITQFHNRLWVTGAAVPNGNQLYGSKYYDGTTWTTGLNATDPVQLSIGLQDNFDNNTAEYVYLDTLYIFKHYSIFALYGFDQTNFQISQLTQECGCIDGGSIQTFAQGLKFVSLRGVESFNGYSCTRISDSIKNKIDPAIQAGGFAQNSWLQSSQADWNSGTFNSSTSLSSTIASPYLVLSTFTASDSSASDFNGGTFSNAQVSGNTVIISTDNSGTIGNPNFETSPLSTNYSATGTSPPVLRSGPLAEACGTVSAQSGTGYLEENNSNTTSRSQAFNLLDANSGSTLYSSSIPDNEDCTWRQITISDSSDSRKRVRFNWTLTTSPDGPSSLTTVSSYIFSGSISFYYLATKTLGGGAVLMIDNIQNGSSTITSGSFTSRTFDTAFSSPAVQVSISSTSNTEPITFVLRHSSSSTGPFVDLTTSQNVGIVSNRYLQYISTFTVGGSDYALSALTGATFTWESSSGAFKSAIHNITSINSWGNFSVQEVLNGGNIAFSICSSTNSNMSFPASCTNQTANTQITLSTGTYVQWYATFTVTAATQAPTLQSGTVQWFAGSKPTPLASTVWDNRYWLSLTTNSVDTANDAVLVLNQNGVWSPYDIHAGAFTQYKNSLYHADSLASGNVYIDNQGFADNGSPINAFITTKNETLGDITADDYLYAIYPSATATGSCAMTVQYVVDSSSVTYSLGSPLLSEFNTLSAVRLPFPIDSTHQDFGQTVNFTIGTNDSSCAWQFLGLEGLYKSRPLQ